MKFTIDRSKWLRGLGSERFTYLRTPEGNMCCLGFVCIQLGVHPADILNHRIPISVVDPGGSHGLSGEPPEPMVGVLLRPGFPKWAQTDLTREAVDINDDDTISNHERERHLRYLFKKHGHTIVFKGKGAP